MSAQTGRGLWLAATSHPAGGGPVQTERLRVARPRRMPSKTAHLNPAQPPAEPAVAPACVQGERPCTSRHHLKVLRDVSATENRSCPALCPEPEHPGRAPQPGAPATGARKGPPARPGHRRSQEVGPVPGTGQEQGGSGPCWSCSACRSRRSSGPRRPSPRSSRQLGAGRADRGWAPRDRTEATGQEGGVGRGSRPPPGTTGHAQAGHVALPKGPRPAEPADTTLPPTRAPLLPRAPVERSGVGAPHRALAVSKGRAWLLFLWPFAVNSHTRRGATVLNRAAHPLLPHSCTNRESLVPEGALSPDYGEGAPPPRGPCA